MAIGAVQLFQKLICSDFLPCQPHARTYFLISGVHLRQREAPLHFQLAGLDSGTDNLRDF